jgi:hypothetical protein
LEDLTLQQANDILSNEQNPDHSKFWKNDRAVVERVNRAFERAHPGDHEIGGGLPAHINDALNDEISAGKADEQQPQTAEQGASEPQHSTQETDSFAPLLSAEEVTEAATELRNEFGDDAPHVLRAAQVVAARLGKEPGMGPTYDKLGKAVVRTFGHAGLILVLAALHEKGE